MKLFIDTSSNLQTIVRLGNKRMTKTSSMRKSQVVLPMIADMLQKQGATLADVTEIGVAIGPGPYTGLRVGVAIANALGYALKIPVNGKQVDKLEIIEPRYE